jgi:predicted GH43/DUF377 family glycosyl hydrolase
LERKIDMIPFKTHSSNKIVSCQTMQNIYRAIETPYKYGTVVKFENDFTDSPSVFYYNGKWYMYYISISKDISISGYETHLSMSDDLIHWVYAGTVFKRNDLNHWDSKQCAGYVAFPNIEFGKSNQLQKINGHYYISYLAGNSDGYEPDPLLMGLAYTDNPIDPDGFTRFENPILRPDDADCRENESKTLYKSYIFQDTEHLTGYCYVNVYNAKNEKNRECIFLSVSNDVHYWERYGDKPIIDDITEESNVLICGDPQIVKINDIYVMFYYKYDASKPAYNTFACSYDLVNWTKWQGKPLIQSQYEWENVHAHKSWVIKHDDVVYHFYCAVNSKNERFIALATSKIFEE